MSQTERASSPCLRCPENFDDEFGFSGTPKLLGFRTSQKRSIPARTDWNLIRDDRVLNNLLILGSHYRPLLPDYFESLQTEITPVMRRMVADWMLEICLDQKFEPEVFCTAMNYLDRFLSRCRISKNQFQLVGAICILISSKFRGGNPISGETLIYYTDNSITDREVKDWELLVLEKLGWELACIVPLDYVDQVTDKLGLNPEVNLAPVKHQAEIVLIQTCTQSQFTYISPSVLACSALLLGFNNFANLISATAVNKELAEIKTRLVEITKTHLDEVESCKNLMQDLFSNHLIQAGYVSVSNNSDEIGQFPVAIETPMTSASIEVSMPTMEVDDDNSSSSTQTNSLPSDEDLESMISNLDNDLTGSSSTSILVN